MNIRDHVTMPWALNKVDPAKFFPLNRHDLEVISLTPGLHRWLWTHNLPTV